MKLLLSLWLLSTISLSAQECTYTLTHQPGGDTQVYQNGVLLVATDYTWTGNTVSITHFSDGDQIAYYYFYYRTKPKSYLPTTEYHTCTGTLNPIPSKYVPYTGATADVDLGLKALNAKTLVSGILGQSSRIYLSAGPVPTNTTDDRGKVYDAVLFFDSSDQKLKILRKDGSISTYMTTDTGGNAIISGSFTTGSGGTAPGSLKMGLQNGFACFSGGFLVTKSTPCI